MGGVALELNISVTFRHTDPTDALRAYAEEKLSNCLRKYVGGSADARVILSVEKRDQVAEIVLHAKNHNLTLKATTADLYSAIDKLSDMLEGQLRKQKERIISSKHQAPEPIA